jgi:hypothetical protein
MPLAGTILFLHIFEHYEFPEANIQHCRSLMIFLIREDLFFPTTNPRLEVEVLIYVGDSISKLQIQVAT